jgi:arylamine N-acetyltransferase
MTTEVTDAVDVAAYFDRIGYRDSAEPTIDTVHALVAAHNGSIPFENLDPLLGIPVADLSAAALPLPAQTHQVLSVTGPGVDGPLLVDVGFGGQTLTSPIRLEAGPVQETCNEPYRIQERGDCYQLEAEIRGAWQPLYMFTTRPQPRIDLEVGSWYVSTYPNSFFVTGLTAALVTEDARCNLRGRNLSIHRSGTPSRSALTPPRKCSRR